MTKKNIHSRAYHQAVGLAKRSGKSHEEAKALGRQAAKEAIEKLEKNC